MDEPVDLTPRVPDPAERHTALALEAVLGGRGADPRRTGLDAALADVQSRAARLHRRRTAVGALTAAAVVALASTVPSLLPAAGTGRPAATPAQSAPVPGDRGPGVAPSSASADPLLSDAEVAASYPGAFSSGSSGSIGVGRPGAPSPAVGGYCGDSPLGDLALPETWENTWRPRGTPEADDVRIHEKVLRWEGPDAGDAVDRYTRATRGSTLVCDGPDGGTYEQLSTTEPGGALASQAVLAPGNATAPDGARSTWRVRSIYPAGDGRTVVELTVDVPAVDGREAARSVGPLLQAAVARASTQGNRPPVGAAADRLPPGPAGALSDRAPAVPRSGPTVPEPTPAWRAPLPDDATLTLQQVRSAVPAPLSPPVLVPAPRATTSLPSGFIPGCEGTASLPSGVTEPADGRSATWVARAADGQPVVEVSERVLRWDRWDPSQAYVAGMQDAATACTTDPGSWPSRPTRASTPWREVQLRSADGLTIEALVRPAGADRPGTWVLRAASAVTVGTTAVDVEVTARAGSPDALVAVMDPLLRAAAERAAADQLRAFARGDVDQPAAP